MVVGGGLMNVLLDMGPVPVPGPGPRGGSTNTVLYWFLLRAARPRGGSTYKVLDRPLPPARCAVADLAAAAVFPVCGQSAAIDSPAAAPAPAAAPLPDLRFFVFAIWPGLPFFGVCVPLCPVRGVGRVRGVRGFTISFVAAPVRPLFCRVGGFGLCGVFFLA